MLGEPQTLQWLVFKHSEVWERETELGEGFYQPTEEDLIVRYLELLAHITLRRGSFYTTLAIGSLLHQFDRRETRLFYDILTQSDSARMKDMNYIGKQRLEMLEKVSQRFGKTIQTVIKPGAEKQFIMRPTDEWVLHLTRESLTRFTPWETSCVIESGFEITDVSGLYFPEGSESDEELVELNRIHTVLDPVCFERFVHGLASYVRTLPGEDQDRACNYDDVDKRIAVPQFSSFPGACSRGDRFNPPPLSPEDYVRLGRTLESRAKRRRTFVPRQLRIYIDKTLSYSLDPLTSKKGQWLIGEAAVIEVRGEGDGGELTLATLILRDFRDGEKSLGGSVTYNNGQQVAIWITPKRDADGLISNTLLEVTYEVPRLKKPLPAIQRILLGLTSGGKVESEVTEPRLIPVSWKTGAAVALILLVAAFLMWQLLKSPQREVPPQHAGPITPKQQNTPIVSIRPSPSPRPSQTARDWNALLAQVRWSTNRNDALKALSLEATRSETQIIDLARDRTKLLISVPIHNDTGLSYSRYRVTLFAAGAPLWQETMRAPKVSLTRYTHILNLNLFTKRLPPGGSYDLQIEVAEQTGWEILGKIRFQSREE